MMEVGFFPFYPATNFFFCIPLHRNTPSEIQILRSSVHTQDSCRLPYFLLPTLPSSEQPRTLSWCYAFVIPGAWGIHATWVCSASRPGEGNRRKCRNEKVPGIGWGEKKVLTTGQKWLMLNNIYVYFFPVCRYFIYHNSPFLANNGDFHSDQVMGGRKPWHAF